MRRTFPTRAGEVVLGCREEVGRRARRALSIGSSRRGCARWNRAARELESALHGGRELLLGAFPDDPRLLDSALVHENEGGRAAYGMQVSQLAAVWSGDVNANDATTEAVTSVRDPVDDRTHAIANGALMRGKLEEP